MTDLMLVIFLVLFALLALFAIVGAFLYGRRRPTASEVTVHGTIDSLRSIGELSVYKVLTKEIVTQVDHSWGDFGRKYLEWVYSSRKMAMIFEFEIDFRYDLKRSDFEIIGTGPSSYILKMPPCHYEANVRNIHFYDEQRSKLMPFLLPDLLNGFLGAGFTEEDRNKLFAAARAHAQDQASALIKSLSSDVEASARQTLQAIGRAFGASHVAVEFKKVDGSQLSVHVDQELKKAA